MLLEKWYQIDLPDIGLPTNLQFLNNAVSGKFSKAKCNEMRYACIQFLFKYFF